MSSFKERVPVTGAETEESTPELCEKVIKSIQQGATQISAVRALMLAKRLQHDHAKLASFRSMVLDWLEETEAGNTAQAGGLKARFMHGDEP